MSEAHPALVKQVAYLPVFFQFLVVCQSVYANHVSGLVHLFTDYRVNGPCLVAARSQGSSLETPPRWHATILLRPMHI